MPGAGKAALRRLWMNVHLCIGVGLCLLLVPIGLSGSLLVYGPEFDALMNPSRYAATSGPSLAPSVLVGKALEAAGPRMQAVSFRLPESDGAPATVIVREDRGEAARGRPRQLTVTLDPVTGRALGVVNARDTLVNFFHRFHENLTIPEYNGRAIVGWAGVGMLILALSGIYLWWPRSAAFIRGLRWRRGPTVPLNLHHMLGIWISIPLAMVSFTGIYLGFPQQGRSVIASFAEMSPRSGFPPLIQQTHLDVERALSAAMAAEPGAQPLQVFMPVRPAPVWRVAMRTSADPALTVLVDDRSGEARTEKPLTGDRTAQWFRWSHEGSHTGTVWRFIVFLCGLAPTAFTITGVMIWLRKRRMRTAGDTARGMPQLDAAE